MKSEKYSHISVFTLVVGSAGVVVGSIVVVASSVVGGIVVISA